jgi:hypothetical protein
VRRLLREGGKADADEAAVGFAQLLPRAHRSHVEKLGAKLDARRIITAVEALPGDRQVRHVLRAHHVEPADLLRLAAERVRQFVDRALDRKARPRPSDAAIGAHRRLVGRDREVARAIVGDRVGAGQVACRHRGFLIGALRPHAVGAGIDDDLRVDAEDAAVAVGMSGDACAVVAGVSAAQQMLAAVLDPAHRVPQFKGEGGHDDLFGVEPRLRPEAAADIGGDDANAAYLEAEELAQCDAHRVRRLGRGVDDDLVEPVVAIGEDAARFERRPRLARHAVFACQGYRGGARRGGDVAAFDEPLEIEVVAPAFVHEMPAAAHVAQRIDDRVQGLELDRDRLRQVLGLAASGRDAGGDRLADIAHLVGGKRRPGRCLGAGRVRR